MRAQTDGSRLPTGHPPGASAVIALSKP